MTAKNKQTTASQVASVITIPGYEIKDLLGKGGMATVYLAVQKSIGREVALKILSPDHTDETFSERFLREARIASQLSHPNIITVYDAGIHNGIHYMSMEYIKGKSFNAARDILTRKQKITVIKEMAQALDFAGKKGFVHRDIKPENILLHQDGRAILTDFGIARANDVSKGLTETGKILGTPYFMSPEQTKGLQIDQRTDIYSLGVVLFQALAGYVPYDGPSIVAICIKHLSDPIPQLPKGLEIFQPIINICLSKKPEHRYQSASDLYHALNKITDKQLDIIEANAAAFKKAGQDKNAETLVEPSSNPQSVTPKQQKPANAPKPSAKRATKSRPVERSTVSSTPNIQSKPTFITESDDFKNLNKRKKRLLLFLILIAVAVGYYNKTELLIAWEKQGEPLARKYLPAEIKKYVFTEQPVKKAPVIKPKPAPLTAEQIFSKKLDSLKSSLNKIPANANELAALINEKLTGEPENILIKQEVDSLKMWYLERLNSLIIKKDFNSSERTLQELKKNYPEITASEEFILTEQKYILSKQIEPHLQKARVYFAVNALNKPAGANALEELRIVLENDPENDEALEGLEKIAQHFKTEAKQFYNNKDYFKALNATNSGLQAINYDTELLELQVKIKSSVTNKSQTKKLLLQADNQFSKGNIIQPSGNSAYDLYQSVLTTDKSNSVAIKGLNKIQKMLLNKANTAIADNKFREASTILTDAQRLFKNSSEIQTARQKLQKEMDAVLPIVPRIKISTTPFTAISETTIQKITPGQLLYFGFEFKNFTQENTNIKVNAYNGDTPKLIEQKAITLSGSQGKHFFTLKLPKTGITNGNYSFELMFGESRLIKANLYGLH